MSQESLDLEDVVRSWVSEFELDSNEKRVVDEVRPTDIDWSCLRIRHGRTQYRDHVRRSTPQTHVLFTTHFTNNTDQQQVFNLVTDRRTKSTCTISMDKTFTIGYTVDIKLCPPNPVVEANAGFKGEMSVTDSNEQTVEEELVWSVNKSISVPPKYMTTAELVLQEEEHSSHFSCETQFRGSVHVMLRNKRTNNPITTLSADVKQLFTAQNGFRVDNSGSYFVSHGQCKCRYGVEQHVRLSQAALTEAGSRNEYAIN